MTRHYSTKDFFRQIPNALLARYFNERELFSDLDFLARKKATHLIYWALGSLYQMVNEMLWIPSFAISSE